MLTTLVIKDFAIISELELTFGSGMTVLSGETGAGKSIIINAMKLLMGGRASTDIVRTGAKEAVVEGLFTIESGRDHVKSYLEQLGVSVLDDEFVVRRTIPRTGRGHIFIGGTLQSVTTLREVMRQVMDISGQHEHVSLLDCNRHLAIVDRYAGIEKRVTAYGMAYHRYASLRREHELLKAQVEERARRLDFLNFEIEELENAGVKPGESERITQEMKRLDHATQWNQAVTQSVEALYENDDSVVTRLGTIIRELRGFTAYGSEVGRICGCLEDACGLIEDAARDLRGGGEQEYSQERMDELQNRLSVIDKLERKYRLRADELEGYCEKLRAERETLAVSDARGERLEGELSSLRTELEKQSKLLSIERAKASTRLEEEATSCLKLLAMEHARIYVQCENTGKFEDLKPTGGDSIEFLLQPNPGEEPKPLSKIASGGELSRVLLALKRVLVDKDEISTYVFDEVDTGIGGMTATHVANMLKEVSRQHQVFCITHLASIACYADTQYQVSKRVVGERTESHIVQLDETSRVMEIARMLGGSSITEKTRDHAAEMISGARNQELVSR